MYDASPSLLWTPIPMEAVLDGMASADVPALVDVTVDGRLLQVVRGTNGTGAVQRLISGNAQDYLDPRWQPGATVSMS